MNLSWLRVRTLRGRLLVVLLGGTIAGLLAMGLTSTALLHRSLIAKTDQKLVDMSRPLMEGRRPPPQRPLLHHPEPGELPTDFRVLFFDRSGNPAAGMLGQSEEDFGGPVMDNADTRRTIQTVPDRAGGSEWRVRTVTLPNGNTIALALSLNSVNLAVRQLVLIELVVGAVVLAMLAAAATVTVRLGLRPLTRIENTAHAIATGDLERRIADQDPRTETGRLGSALNTMLGRLVAALQQREQSEARLRRFVADASHELRTPLTSIRGFAELYRRSDQHQAEDVRLMMSRIENEAARMGFLVDDLLLLARLDRERSIDLTDLDMVPLVHDIVHAGRARAPERVITVLAPDNAVWVLGEGQRLRQALTNLLTNALLHTTPGTPVDVVVKHGVSSNDALSAAGSPPAPATPVGVVEIADTGPGIASEHARHIFDRFYRVDNGRERSEGGTGLGLAITAAIAEAHNGRAELVPNEAGGCTFRLLIPLA